MDASSAAKSVSIPIAFALSGYSFFASQCALPAAYGQPASVTTAVFQGLFYGGAKIVVPGALASATASSYLAYQYPERRRLFASAAVLVVATLPWTGLVMTGGIQRLLEIGRSAAAQQKADQTGEVMKLLRTWALQNYVRASLYFAGGVAGWLALQ